MKNAQLGDYFHFDDQPVKVIGIIDRKAVVMEPLEDDKCPHCGASVGKTQFPVIVTSPLFQMSAKPMPTITNDS